LAEEVAFDNSRLEMNARDFAISLRRANRMEINIGVVVGVSGGQG
jgi:hypothetical protein